MFIFMFTGVFRVVGTFNDTLCTESISCRSRLVIGSQAIDSAKRHGNDAAAALLFLPRWPR